jgi:DNA-binding NarL/FixJ family response regulator
MIKVLIVDDHEVVRVGLTTLLSTAADVEVVGQAADGRQAISQAAVLRPDVVLMDLSMPELDGVAATEILSRDQPGVRTLVLTSFADHARVRAALAVGAKGYLLKDCTPEELLSAIRSAAAGHNPLDPRVARALLPELGQAGPVPESAGLSVREIEVLRLVSTGLANKQVARQLGMSERTVKVHLGNVFRRIGVGDRTSAALWAREHLD